MSDIGIEAPGSRTRPNRRQGSSRTAGRGLGRGRRRSVSQRQRPLWMLAPGGVLMTAGRPHPAGAGLLYLPDRSRPVHAASVGERTVHRTRRTTSRRSPTLRCCVPIWISVSFAVISTVVTIPFGVAAAVVTQNAYSGRVGGSRDLPHSVRPAVVRGGHRVAHDAAAGRNRQHHPGQDGRGWLACG